MTDNVFGGTLTLLNQSTYSTVGRLQYSRPKLSPVIVPWT